jgi:hypothetical protein
MVNIMEDKSPRILLITEDSSRQGIHVITTISKAILRRIFKHELRESIRFEPAESDLALEKSISILHGNKWRSKGRFDEYAIRNLIQYVATIILQPGGFVFWHLDGDTIWSLREQAITPSQFNKIILDRVHSLIDGKADPIKLNSIKSKIKVIVPYYSIESWLFQNEELAIKLCQTHRYTEDITKFTAWSKDRSLLDEIMKPKDQVKMGSRYNNELVENLKIDPIIKVGKSMGYLAQQWEECAELRKWFSVKPKWIA